jgi:hypothetical protein
MQVIRFNRTLDCHSASDLRSCVFAVRHEPFPTHALQVVSRLAAPFLEGTYWSLVRFKLKGVCDIVVVV